MRADNFFALTTGVHRLPDGQPARFEKYALGALRVGSGMLAVCDPIFLQNPGIVSIPAGDYEVVASIAHVPESYDYGLTRPAYLSLVISDNSTETIEPVKFEENMAGGHVHPIREIHDLPELRGIETSQMSSVAMTDAESVIPGMPADPETWFDTVISPGDGTGWFERMDTEKDGPLGALMTSLPYATNGENIAMLIARPDLVFPVVQSVDSQGRITGIHIDLLVVGEPTQRLKAFDGPDEFSLSEPGHSEDVSGRRERTTSGESGGLLTRLRKFFTG